MFIRHPSNTKGAGVWDLPRFTHMPQLSCPGGPPILYTLLWKGAAPAGCSPALTLPACCSRAAELPKVRQSVIHLCLGTRGLPVSWLLPLTRPSWLSRTQPSPYLLCEGEGSLVATGWSHCTVCSPLSVYPSYSVAKFIYMSDSTKDYELMEDKNCVFQGQYTVKDISPAI